MVESLLFIGAGAGAGQKKTEPVKNRPAPQHCIYTAYKKFFLTKKKPLLRIRIQDLVNSDPVSNYT